MIKIIYGSKGTGKTKKIIDMANEAVATADGDIVFLADTKRYVREINIKIRFIDTKDNGHFDESVLIGFIKGLVAGNYDIKDVFIDGAARMMGAEIEKMENFLSVLDEIGNKNGIIFVLTVSRDKELLPKFFEKYITD